jgi:hypothetical protein
MHALAIAVLVTAVASFVAGAMYGRRMEQKMLADLKKGYELALQATKLASDIQKKV